MAQDQRVNSIKIGTRSRDLLFQLQKKIVTLETDTTSKWVIQALIPTLNKNFTNGQTMPAFFQD